SYMGHSSYAMWGLNASGILLSAAEARQLGNATPLLITQWGCWNTYFVNPKQDTMANAFLFQPYGAAAVLGATALSDINVLSGLGNTFFKQLGQSTTLGEALQAAQRTHLNQNPAAASKLRGFALLGDPAAEVR
ncbi:MAG TPA: C25 family cysteine peptidase, partial [Candidatus Competibacter phosphatis]|nr:C25 family cysteine peptidase [Candidatus Competibacter phosphatis]